MRREVLEIASYPEIAFELAEVEAETVARGRSRLRLVGLLALHLSIARGTDNRVLAYLATLSPQLTKLDHVILSHPHRDHVELMADDMSLPGTLQRKGIQFAWLNTGGVQGDNPVCHAAAHLEMLGVPYVGHNPLCAALLDEKDVLKRQLQALGVLTVKGCH